MPVLSFQERWLDKLLKGEKQQTTRPQTDRIKKGAVCTIYNQQRRHITSKPTRRMTQRGMEVMKERGYPFVNEFYPYHAHLLGKVKITEVYDMRHAIGTFPIGLEEWALKDGFDTYLQADAWFTKRYGKNWLYQNWTVIQWDSWLERYFEPMEAI